MDAHGIEAKETIPASRKLGRKDAAELAKAASKVIVAKGKKVSEFKTGGKASDEVVEAMLGPTGNLRAPTLRKGKTVIVGYNDEVFEAVFL
jgi:arsenate reductase-like glutaredoxin family protein